jgi:subtilase family serine protease
MRRLPRVVVLAVALASFAVIGAGAAGAGPPNLPPQANLPSTFVCGPPGQALGFSRCHARVISDASGTPLASGGPVGYGPAQFQTAYGLPSTTAGTGQTIGIVDAYDDPTAEQDLATYSAAFGLPACTTANGCFKKVNQTGGTKYPKKNGGWALEISLDVQVAHAVCPNCKILLVEASSNSFTNLLAAEDYATSHANVVSNSWGANESSSETGYDSHFNRPGVPITVSSGDSGFGVEYPAASQYVTAVGGTTLSLNADNTRSGETAWSGAGSGCSAYEAKPSWQHDAGCARRTVADVSADADPNTGAAVYDSTPYCTFFVFNCTTGWYQVGGTSLAAPLVASVYALAGNGGSTLHGSYPYSHSSSLYDVTAGSNGSCGGSYLCTAGAGYDGPTGLGSPTGTGGF